MFPLCRSLKNSFSCSLKKVNSSSSGSDDEYNHQTMKQTKSCDKLSNNNNNKKKNNNIIISSSVVDLSHTKNNEHDNELNTNFNKTNNNNKFVKFIRKKILNGFSKYLFYLFEHVFYCQIILINVNDPAYIYIYRFITF